MADEIAKVEKEVKRDFKKFLKNYWAIATIVLAILLIAVLVYGMLGKVSANTAGQRVVDFANSQGANASLVSARSNGTLYEVVVSIQGQDVPVYVTKDGKYLITSPIPLVTQSSNNNNNNAQPANVPKSDKPVLDLYVFSYCPYGTQMEKALVPVYNLLKNKATINIVFIGAMHGEFEKVESLRQICIKKEYGNDKLFAYLDKFLVNEAVGNCQGTETCVNPLIESIYTQLSIDKTKINTCMTNDAPALYAADEQRASSLGYGSSPTVTINGVEAQLSRSPAAVEAAICSAFNTTPTECSTQLSSNSASAGFGSTASSGSAASCG